MKKVTRSFLGISLLVFTMFSFTGCQIIGDIFKAGMWVGILVVVAIVGLIIWLVSKASGGGDK